MRQTSDGPKTNQSWFLLVKWALPENNDATFGHFGILHWLSDRHFSNKWIKICLLNHCWAIMGREQSAQGNILSKNAAMQTIIAACVHLSKWGHEVSPYFSIHCAPSTWESVFRLGPPSTYLLRSQQIKTTGTLLAMARPSSSLIPDVAVRNSNIIGCNGYQNKASKSLPMDPHMYAIWALLWEAFRLTKWNGWPISWDWVDYQFCFHVLSLSNSVGSTFPARNS